jgi:exodeoxyribonuclease VII large subunit
MSRAPTPAAPARQVLSVSEVNRLVREVLEGELPPVWVAGEVSNLRRPTSGHVYLSLKDAEGQVKAVIWRTTAARIPFRLEDGIEVVCFGRVTVYEPRGEYQIAIDVLEPKGIGAAQLALEQLKKRLQQEGLFDPARKRALPRFPSTIGLVTSATGAAVKDILQVIERRCPRLRIVLAPVRVQGDGAAREVAAAVIALNSLRPPHAVPDVLIVGRGGGSAEDLSAFNDEGVARAIAGSRIPVVSAVGHEIDTTIADLVADRRALTPTEAAELATPNVPELLDALAERRDRLRKAVFRGVRAARERLDLVARGYAFREPQERVRRLTQRLDELSLKLPREARRRLEQARDRLSGAAAALQGLSPLGVLARGYSVTTRDADGAPLRDAAALAPGERLRTRLARGEVLSTVVEARPSARDALAGLDPGLEGRPRPPEGRPDASSAPPSEPDLPEAPA